MRTFCFARLASIALAGVVLACGPVRTVEATATFGTSNSYGINVSVTFTPIVGTGVLVSTGPIASIGGTAPLPYGPLTATASPFISLLSGSVMSDDASSNVDGFPGVHFANADSTFTSLTLGTLFPLLPPLFTLTIPSISTTANVTGDLPTLTPTGSTTLSALVFTAPLIPGFPTLTFSGSPAPNTQLAPSGFGISVLLNEQILSGNGVTAQSIEVNGLDIAFTVPVFTPTIVPLRLGTLTGNIIVAHTEAFLTAAAVPEPPSISLFASGCLVLAFWMWKRR